MTTKEQVDVLAHLSHILRKAIDNNEELSESERVHIMGICAGLDLSVVKVNQTLEEEIS